MINSDDMISVVIPYRSFFIEQPYLVLNQDCIVNGLEITGEIIDENIIQIKINPGWLILSNTPIYIPDAHFLRINVSYYDDSNPLFVFCHFETNKPLNKSVLKYSVAVYDQINQKLLTSIDYLNNLDSSEILLNSVTILLCEFNYKKENNDLVSISDSLPSRTDIVSYFDPKSYYINRQYFKIMPYDRITARFAEIIYFSTGGSGGSGHRGQDSFQTGGIGYTSGTGGTGSPAGPTRKIQLRYFIYRKCYKSNLWVINHNFNQKYVFVTCYDDYNLRIYPKDIFLDSHISCRLSFEDPISGYAIIVAGPILHKDLIELYKSLEQFKFDDDLNFKGEVGDIGERGQIGYTGIKGLVGIPGKDGKLGPTGLRGYTGQVGKIGLSGCRGSIGFAGEPGESGKDSLTGGSGGSGRIGNSGHSGYTGRTGHTGGIGGTGYTGGTGAEGTLGPEYNGDIGGTGGSGSKGATGAAGLTGETGLQGNTGVEGQTGATGLPFSTASDLETLRWECTRGIFDILPPPMPPSFFEIRTEDKTEEDNFPPPPPLPPPFILEEESEEEEVDSDSEGEELGSDDDDDDDDDSEEEDESKYINHPPSPPTPSSFLFYLHPGDEIEIHPNKVIPPALLTPQSPPVPPPFGPTIPRGSRGIPAFSSRTLEVVDNTESFQFPDNGPFYYYFIHEQPVDIIRNIKFTNILPNIYRLNLFDHIDHGFADSNQIITATNVTVNLNKSKYHPILKGFYYKIKHKK